MKIQIIKPCAVCVTEDGSRTERFGIGEAIESKDKWMEKRLKGLIESGHATEAGGNAAPTETKTTAKKKVVKKKPSNS